MSVSTRTFIVLIVLVAVGRGQSGLELFKNPGFEDPDIESVYGHAWGYKAKRVTDSHSGSYAVKLSGRTAYWQGIGQDVSLKPGARYSIHAYVKLLNSNQKLWQKFSFTASYQWTSTDANDKSYLNYADRAFSTPQDGWFKLGGDFTPPSKTWYKLHIYIQGPDPGIEFLVDDFSLQEIPENTNWKTEANQRIESIRKTNFSLSVSIADNFDPHHVEIQISHKKHKFAFGSLVQDSHMLNPSYTGYQNLFYEFFNWATVGSYKWKYNQGNRTHPNYDRSLMVTEELRKHGLPVRGHNMFWGVSDNTPAWVLQETADQLNATIIERTKFMTGITKGKLDHWDVNNELLHGQEYEEITKDPTYTQGIFRLVHQLDPGPKLFLNDYNVVAVGANTDDYINQGNAFKAANVGLYGLGLQSHFKSYVAPDPTLLKYRLDKLATTGLPLWITEMTLENSDENVRANWFENALTTYFSHPSVEGVILWGFWDEFVNPNAALVNGNYLYVNAAGKRWLDLIKSQWSTNIKASLSSNHTRIDVRGFHGDYDVTVRYLGKAIQQSHFSIDKTDTGKVVNVTVAGSGHEIVLPTSRPTSVPIQQVHHLTHGHTRTLGHASTAVHQSHMTCSTRWSGLSAIGDDKSTDVSCLTDEVMTGCSSRTQDGRSFRDGELIVMKGGVPYCRAVNAWRSAGPVQAIARCCKKTGLQCTYMSAGPSTNGEGDQIQVTCPATTFATGCTSYTYYGNMDGAFSDGQSCTAQNDGTQGVFAYAACCNATGTTCYVRTSPDGGIRQGDVSTVTCHHGETMLGCSTFSEDGHTAGANIENGNCTAVNGLDRFPGEEGVKAIAICCT